MPVAPLAEAPLVLTINAKALPFGRCKDFVAHAKANPGKHNYGSSGTGTPPHILGRPRVRQAGLEVQHVPIAAWHRR